jgi:hypothetical protein
MYSIVLWYIAMISTLPVKSSFRQLGLLSFQLTVVLRACGCCISIVVCIYISIPFLPYNIWVVIYCSERVVNNNMANPVLIILFKQWYMFNWKKNPKQSTFVFCFFSLEKVFYNNSWIFYNFVDNGITSFLEIEI